MDYRAMISAYTASEDALRQRAAEVRCQLKTMPYPARDLARRRLALLQEELFDVMLVRMELTRRQKEEEETLC